MMLRTGLALVRASSRTIPRCVLASTTNGQSFSGVRFNTTNSDSPVTTASRDDVFVYTSPYGPAVRHVKKLSLFSCACALGAGPVILGLDSEMTLVAKASLASTLAAFGVFTTGLLHWFVSPYVQRLEVDKKTGAVMADVLTILGTPKRCTFHIADAEPVDGFHPLTSFQALGRTYYIDPAHFEDKQLLAQLAPTAAAEAAAQTAEQEIQQINSKKNEW